MENAEIKNKLKEIININVDGYKGFEKAANHMDNDEIQTIFLRLAQQRKLFSEELNNLTKKDLGFEIDSSGTVVGFFHRNWIDATSKISDKSDKSIINDALQGEDSALKVYNEVIQGNELPDYIEEKLKDQRTLIEGSRNQLHSFKSTEVEVS